MTWRCCTHRNRRIPKTLASSPGSRLNLCSTRELPLEHMRKLPTILLAAISGIAIEVALCATVVISAFTGGIGPCGPTGNAAAFVAVIHQPGFLLAGLLVENSSPLYLLLAVAITAVLLSVLAFIILKFGIRRKEVSIPCGNSVPGS